MLRHGVHVICENPDKTHVHGIAVKDTHDWVWYSVVNDPNGAKVIKESYVIFEEKELVIVLLIAPTLQVSSFQMRLLLCVLFRWWRPKTQRSTQVGGRVPVVVDPCRQQTLCTHPPIMDQQRWCRLCDVLHAGHSQPHRYRSQCHTIRCSSLTTQCNETSNKEHPEKHSILSKDGVRGKRREGGGGRTCSLLRFVNDSLFFRYRPQLLVPSLNNIPPSPEHHRVTEREKEVFYLFKRYMVCKDRIKGSNALAVGSMFAFVSLYTGLLYDTGMLWLAPVRECK